MSNKPKAVFTIIESERLEKPLWRRIGSAFENRDGSTTILLDALPMDGKLNVREDKPRNRAEEA